jgi:hypothetical protein
MHQGAGKVIKVDSITMALGTIVTTAIQQMLRLLKLVVSDEQEKGGLRT